MGCIGTIFSFFIPCILLIFLLSSVHPTQGQPLTVNIGKGSRGRLFSISSRAPISRTLAHSETVKSTTARLIHYFEHTDTFLTSQLHKHPHNASLNTCNSHDQSWNSAIRNVVRHHGWPIPSSRPRTCVTDFFSIPQHTIHPPFSGRELFDLISRRAIAVNDFAKRIAAVTQSNWTRPVHPVQRQFHRGSMQCQVDHMGAFRVRGTWYISIIITNEPQNFWLADWQRQYVAEYVRVSDDGSRLEQALMTLPLHPGTGEVHAVVADSTTVFSMRAGPAHPSQFYPQALESNPALTDALDQGGEHVQQVEDAIAISNIAILALPMVLTLVPIAAIADVSRTRMVLYLILSDVLTTVPMGIKGVELLLIAKQEFIGTVTRMSDTAADKMENTAVSELWVAQCGIRASVKPYGIAFVTVSVVMLVLGVVSEVIARWWIGKRARRKQVVLADGGKMVDGVAGVAGVTMAYETLSRDYFDDDLVEGGIGWKGGYAADD